jgi:hypothetical protein
MVLQLGKKSLEKSQQEFKNGEVTGSNLQGNMFLSNQFSLPSPFSNGHVC